MNGSVKFTWADRIPATTRQDFRLLDPMEDVMSNSTVCKKGLLRFRRGNARALILIAVVVCLSGYTIRKPPSSVGEPDVTFGDNGKVKTDFFGSRDVARAMAIQSDGRIVVAGDAGPDPLISDFAVARYNPDGSPDSAFGTGGKVITEFTKGFGHPQTLAIQPDSKIIVAGYTYTYIDGTSFAIARYNPDGSLDAGFGNQGKVLTEFLDGYSRATSIAIQSDGKIIIGGWTTRLAILSYDFALARYNSDGSLDSSFGNGGKVITDFNNRSDRSSDLALQPDGKILLAGTASDGRSNFALARYNPDGNLDLSFGNGGKSLFGFAQEYVRANAVALQSDGSIIVGGIVIAEPISSKVSDIAIVRFHKDGQPDAGFGAEGKVIRDIDVSDELQDIAIQHDDRIIAAGYAGKPTADSALPADSKIVLARYNVDGSFDRDFNASDLSGDTPRNSYASAVLLDTDGRVVVTGFIDSGASYFDFLLARFINEAIIPPAPAKDFSLTTDSPVVTVSRGKKAKVLINVSRTGDFDGNVTVTAPDTDAIKVVIKPGSLSTTGGSVRFSLKVRKSAQRGDHQIVFKGGDESGRERVVVITISIG